MPKSWKPEVIADNTGTWTSNALRFATEAEAAAYARDLSSRWMAVRKFRAGPSEDPVAHAFIDGNVVNLETK